MSSQKAAQFWVSTCLQNLLTSPPYLLLFLAVRKDFSPGWLPVFSLTWWHALDLGGSQEKPPSAASVGPCLFPVTGFLDHFSFMSVSWKHLARTLPCLAHTSLETHGCHSPVCYDQGAGNLILLHWVSFSLRFCPDESQISSWGP